MKLPVILLLAGLAWHSSQGQAPEPPPVGGTVYGGLAAALPLGPFRDAYPGGQAFGATFGLLVKPGAPPLPFEVGLELNYLVNGITKNKVHTLSPPYTIKTTHSYIPLHAVFRLKSQRPRTFSPYGDALAGITLFNSRSKIKQDFFASQEEEATVLEKYNATIFSYGLAAGLLVKGKRGLPRLDIRLVYLEGPLGTYVKRGNLTVDTQGYPLYRFTRSETSMLLLQLNVAGLSPGS